MILLPIVFFSIQYWIYLKIVQRLKTHHPNKWVGLGMPSGAPQDSNEVTPEFLAEQSLYSFLVKEDVSKLKDKVVDRLVFAWRFVGVVAVIAFIVAFFGGIAQ